jgi:hypothetical protein
MALDPVVNFFQSEIATLPVASGGTVIVLSSGDGAKLPNPAVDGAFNLTIYEDGNPFSSPEIVRVTGRSSDTLTVTRAQEGTTATTKIAGTTWKVVMFPTAKTIQDIDSKKVEKTGDTMTGTLTATKLIPSGNVTAGNGMYLPAANTVAVSTNGVERLRILSSGEVGIGGVPVYPLSVIRTSGSSVIQIQGENNAESTLLFGDADSLAIGRIVYSHVNDSFRFWTNGVERYRVDSSGNVGIGTTAPSERLHINGLGAKLFVQDTLQGAAGFIAGRLPTTVISGTSGAVDYALVVNNTERMRITTAGVVHPGADNTQTLGNASFRWSEVFAGNGTINTSDATEKQDIAELNEAEQQVAVALKGLIRKYRWIEAVERKGDDARIHVGVMAQDVAQSFEDAGLDAEHYGVFCKDVWYTKEETYTEQVPNPDFDEEAEEGEDNPRMIDGEEQTRIVPCESDDPDATEHIRYGVRYDQLWAFIISAL